jgi:hypothetical protein
MVTSTLTGGAAHDEVLVWELPSKRLRSREALPPERIERFSLTPTGGLLLVREAAPAGPGPALCRYERERLVAQREASGGLFADGEVEAEVTSAADGTWIVDTLGRNLQSHARLTLPSPPRLRAQGRVLVAMDGEGRVVAVDLARRQVLANLRVQP